MMQPRRLGRTRWRPDRLRTSIGADPDVGEDSLGDFDRRITKSSPHPAFGLYRDRRVADLFDVAKASDLVADHDWAMKIHRGDRDSHHASEGASRGNDRSGKIHLAQQPAAEDVAVRIGVRWHGNSAECRL